MRFLCSLIICSLHFYLLNAQQVNDKIIADQFFIQAEYTKALELYNRAYKNNKTDFEVYSRILECYVILKDLNTADKHIKKLYSGRRIEKIQWAYGMSDVKSRKKKHSSEILIFSDAIKI